MLPHRRRDRDGSRRRKEQSAGGPIESGLFDPWYYALQTGTALSSEAALHDFVTVGAEQGLTPNPLTDWAATGLVPDEIVAALLDGSARVFPVRPLFDDLGLLAQSPAAADHPGGPVGFYLTHAHAGSPVPALGKQTWTRFVKQRGQQSASLKAIDNSGLFDLDYYALQAGRTFLSLREATWHFLEVGEAMGLSPSPLFERAWYRRAAKARVAQTFAHFLRHQQTAGAAGPHFDAAVYLAECPEAADHRGGPLGHFLENANHATVTVPSPGSGVTPTSWETLLAETTRCASEFGGQLALTQPRGRRWAGWYLDRAEPEVGTSQSIAIFSDFRAWNRSVPAEIDDIRAQTHGDWTMSIAVDADQSIPEVLAELTTDPRFILVPTQQESWAERANDVVATLVAPWTCAWQPGETWSPSLLSGLLSGVSGGRGAYAAISSDNDDSATGPEVVAELPSRDAMLWGPPRSLAAMLLPTQRLRDPGGRFRAEAADQYGWDFLLRCDPDLNFVPFVGVRGTGVGNLPCEPGLPSAHEQVLRAEQIISWTAVDTAVPLRVSGRVSLLIPTFRDRVLTRDAITSALEGADGDVEVVVIDNGSDREVSAILVSCFAADPRVHIRRVARNTNFATASNLALAASTGEFVVFLNNDTRARKGWLSPLIEALQRPEVVGAQPLLVYEDESVQSAGTVFQGPQSLPVHLLASHPVEDAMRGEELKFHAVTAACMAVRADMAVEARGFDPIFVNGMEDIDLCLRLIEAHGGHFVTARASRVTHLESKTPGRFARVEPNRLRFLERWGDRLPGPQDEGWEQAGFEVVGRIAQAGLPASGRRTALKPMLIRPRSLNVDGRVAGLPRLRWAIKNSAPGGLRGDHWGDTFFADDLAAALRAWGQDAFVDRREAHVRPGVDHLDDVTLALRGRAPAAIQPGATNILWVISHPDDVPVSELRQGFDLMYSAGRSWADHMSSASGREVRTLLQATNTFRFTPEGDRLDVGGALFVGRTRGVMRPIVRDAVELGADLRIFGNGWDEYVHAEYIAAENLPNSELPAAYRGARIVLNDHWDDMARHGFYSNRLFDAVASGAKVISDPVDGIEEVFGPSVRVYRTLDELRQLLDPTTDLWPNQDDIAANSAAVATAHSFAERARRLLADVLDVRGVAHDLYDR